MWNLRSLKVTMMISVARKFAVTSGFKIYKYWKPIGTVSTTFLTIPDNIVASGRLSQSSLALFNEEYPLVPIGRLDKDSSGLLLITSDQSLSAQLLRTYNSRTTDVKQNTVHDEAEMNNEDDMMELYGSKYEKVYHIKTGKYVSDSLLDRLQKGVIITTSGRRKGAPKSSRKTLPCVITRINNTSYSDNSITNNDIKDSIPNVNIKRNNHLEVILHEGRNRQIRKMFGSIGHDVTDLQRVSFAGIDMTGLHHPGDMIELSEVEKKKIDL